MLTLGCIILSKLLYLLPHLLTIAVHLLNELQFHRLLSIIPMAILKFSQGIRREGSSQEISITLWDRKTKVDLT